MPGHKFHPLFYTFFTVWGNVSWMLIHYSRNDLRAKNQKTLSNDNTHTHRAPLRHGPVALAGWTRAVFDVWWLGHWVTRSGLIRAPDITGHLGLATTFSRTLDGGAKRLCDLLSGGIYQRWLIPQSTLPPPTVGRRQGSYRVASL